MSHSDSHQRPPRGIVRTLAGPLAALVVLVVAGRLVGGSWPAIEASVADMGRLGWVVFVAAWALLSALCFPVSVLGFSAGLLFGPWLGLLLVALGGLLGGSFMFALAHGLLRGRIRELVDGRPRLAAIDRMAGREDVKLNVLTRLSPLNFGLASYTLGAGKSRFRAYAAGLVATLPSMIAQVWFGALAGRAGSAAAAEEGFPWGRTLLLVAGVAFFAVLSWQVGRMVRRAWNEPDPATATGDGSEVARED
jgi:uncharacterized membrane protein YdjX (TVP38/TMEM64 family)